MSIFQKSVLKNISQDTFEQDTKNLDKIEPQAFNYHNSDSNSKYIIISNFDETWHIDKKTVYEKFSLFNLNYEEFITLPNFLIFIITPQLQPNQQSFKITNH